MRKILLAVFVGISLVGCRVPSLFATSPGVSATANSAGAEPHEEAPLTLSGQVRFPRRVQATIEDDVAVAATVSLINTGSNQTEATGVTDSQGRFTLTLPKSYRPDSATTYYLEAVKGLNDNKPGYAVARVRTIVKYNNGWLSLTNLAPNQGVSINEMTTAVAIGAALRRGTALSVDFAALLGQVSGDVYAPVTNLSASDVTALASLVSSKLAAEKDPVGAVTLNAATNTFESAAPEAPEVSTASAAVTQVGGAVTLTGSGFSSTPGNNVVKVNGTPVTVTSASLTSLTIQIPSGTTSGQVTVQVGSLIILGPVLSVSVQVTGFGSASRKVGESLGLTGTGFDPSSLANNVVVFTGGATGSVTAATATSLTVTVPSGAVSGPVTVSVLGSQGVSASSLQVTPTISGFSPTGGVVGTSVVLSGTGFSSTLASNSVTVNGMAATLTQASATSLRFTVPTGATTGAIAVTVVGQTVNSGGSFTVGQGLTSSATIQTIAGTKTPPANRQASDWSIPNPRAIARDGSGNTYVAADGRIYKIDGSGVITHFAGTGDTTASDGDGGPATSARFSNEVYALAVDGSGNLYFADSGKNCIRKVDTSGTISTYAGVPGLAYDGNHGDTGDRLAAHLNAPRGLALDGSGNLYISDTMNCVIRKVVASSGVITKIAGSYGSSTFDDGGGDAKNAGLYWPEGLLLDGDNLYVADAVRVWRIGLSGGTITFLAGAWGANTLGYVDASGTSARFNDCLSIVKDASGNLYVGDRDNHCVRKIDGSNNVTTVAGTGVSGYSGDGWAATSAQLNTPCGVALDAAGRLYVADYGNYRIRRVEGGAISTVWCTGLYSYSGDGGLAVAAQLQPGSHGGVALDSAGNLYFADMLNYRIRKIDRVTGVISIYAGTGANASNGDGGQATAASLQPTGLAFDASDNLYVGDWIGNSVRRIDRATGVISTFATISLKPRGLAFDASGNLYVARANSTIQGFGGTVAKIDPQGNVTTFAGGGASLADGVAATSAKIDGPSGVAVDAAGNVYVVAYANHKVRKVDTNGVISTVAGTGTSGGNGDGGPANMAQLQNPYGLALDTAGTLYIAEYGGHRIRKVDPSGNISKVAGTTQGFSGDGSQAGSAQFNYPTGLALGDFGGMLYVNDSFNCRVRRLQ